VHVSSMGQGKEVTYVLSGKMRVKVFGGCDWGERGKGEGSPRRGRGGGKGRY